MQARYQPIGGFHVTQVILIITQVSPNWKIKSLTIQLSELRNLTS